MAGYSSAAIWAIIVALGVGTFAIRFSFLGLLGDRELPPSMLRYLRYTPVAVIPALMAPLLAWPSDTGGSVEPIRLLAAAVTIAIGVMTKNIIIALAAGAGAYFALAALV